MIELFLALLIGLIAVGIVVTMLRDSRRHGYPSGYRRRAQRAEPVETEARGTPRRTLDAHDDDADFVEPAPAPTTARREARAVPSAPSPRSDRGERRSGLLVAGVALAAAAAVLLVIVVRPWDGGGSQARNEVPEGGGAGATAGATPTAPAGAARTATATPTVTRTSTPAPANAATLEVQARQQTNVRVTVDGRQEFEGSLRAGETRSWAGSAQVQLWTDNGKNVAVTVNGFDLGALSTAVGHPEWNTVDWGWAAGWRP